MGRKLEMETSKQYIDNNWVQLAQMSIARANDGILWLSNKGQVIYANEAMSNMLDYKLEELYSLSIKDIHPEYPEYESQFQLLKHKNGKDTIEANYKTKGGKLFPVEVSGNYANVDNHEFNCCIIRDISERKRIETQLNANYFNLQQKESRIHELTKAYINAQEKERQSLSIELHDRVIQKLVTLMQKLDEIENIKVYEVRQQLIMKLRESLAEGVSETRCLMKALFPSSLQRYGLVNLFEQELIELEEILNIKSILTSNLKSKLSHEIETTLYRIGHEGLNNIRKHGHNVRNVTLALIENGNHIELDISNDGQGFDINCLPTDSLHRGIECMQQRAELLNGCCTVSSHPGTGTSIKVWLPNSGD